MIFKKPVVSESRQVRRARLRREAFVKIDDSIFRTVPRSGRRAIARRRVALEGARR